MDEDTILHDGAWWNQQSDGVILRFDVGITEWVVWRPGDTAQPPPEFGAPPPPPRSLAVESGMGQVPNEPEPSMAPRDALAGVPQNAYSPVSPSKKVWYKRKSVPVGGGLALIAIAVAVVLLSNKAPTSPSGSSVQQVSNDPQVSDDPYAASVRDLKPLWEDLDQATTRVMTLFDQSVESNSVLTFIETAESPANDLARAASRVPMASQLSRAASLAADIADNILKLKTLHETYRAARVAGDSRASDILAERDSILYELRDMIPTLRQELDAVRIEVGA